MELLRLFVALYYIKFSIVIFIRMNREQITALISAQVETHVKAKLNALVLPRLQKTEERLAKLEEQLQRIKGRQ
jgi:hypothetical protein